uniref:C2H2-type domain-containing protein n=1 Tax=Caenorhabditis japonica TaxID=281687 RepID=A0A8R1HN47_CAEJA
MTTKCAEHQCQQCFQRFPHLSKLQRHLETHLITGDWLCNLCTTLCSRFTALTDHWRSSCPELKYVFCENELKNMSTDDLRETIFRYISMGEQHRHDETICTFCHLHVPRGYMTHHLETHSGQKKVGRKTEKSAIPRFCDLCGLGFRFKRSLYAHWRQNCPELLAFFKSSVQIDNQLLTQIVATILRQAEIYQPVRIEPDGVETSDDDDVETSSHYSARIILPTIVDRKLWNMDQTEKRPTCPQCFRIFHSEGRLRHHINTLHADKKSMYTCELCQMKFKQQRILNKHLRESCRAMRVEEPDKKRRKLMPKEELLAIIERGKPRWSELFELKKSSSLQFISDFLNELDRKRGTMEKRIPAKLAVPPSKFSESGSGAIGILGSPDGGNICEFCSELNIT